MKKYLFIVLLVGVGFGQQQLPPLPKGFVLELQNVGGTIKGEGDSEIDPDEVKREIKTMERLCNTYIKGDWDYE